MSAHIIGRPNDDLLDLILGPGADPELDLILGPGADPQQAFMGGCEKGLEERLPTLPTPPS